MSFRVRDSKKSWDRLLKTYLKRRRRKGGRGHGLPEPVEPNSPKFLSGGAAAALEFDD